MVEHEAPSATPIVSQDAQQELPGAREALAHLREVIRYYPPLYRTSEYHACQQTLMEMIQDLEMLAEARQVGTACS